MDLRQRLTQDKEKLDLEIRNLHQKCRKNPGGFEARARQVLVRKYNRQLRELKRRIEKLDN